MTDTLTQAAQLAADLNDFRDDPDNDGNWADLTRDYVSEDLTAAAGLDYEAMGNSAADEVVCYDGSRLTFSGGRWVAV